MLRITSVWLNSLAMATSNGNAADDVDFTALVEDAVLSDDDDAGSEPDFEEMSRMLSAPVATVDPTERTRLDQLLKSRLVSEEKSGKAKDTF